jgi:hypothetical protein
MDVTLLAVATLVLFIALARLSSARRGSTVPITLGPAG